LNIRQMKSHQNFPWIHVLFFCSGFPALIYQIVWQRALFSIYGLNIQSVTIVVSGFMLGLGLGSLLGGKLSNSRRLAPVTLFAAAELSTGIFGIVSLQLFHHIGEFTAGTSLFEAGLISFLVIVLSTLLMGATLPLLVEHSVRSSMNVGSSVGGLYFANTLGSGFACFLAAAWLMRHLGQSGSVRFAALVNVLVAAGAVSYNIQRSHPGEDHTDRTSESIVGSTRSLLPYSLALGCAAFSGFAALAYEIIWYRLIAFGTGDTAAAFATLLGAYLSGLALGSRLIERYSLNHGPENAVRKLGAILFASAMVAFSVSPLSAWALGFISPNQFGSPWPGSIILLLVCIAASFFGATFPLIAYVAVSPAKRAGSSLSYLYAANIIGSTLGTLVVGYILLDYLSVYQISILLLVGGAFFAVAVLAGSTRPLTQLTRELTLAGAVMMLLIVGSRPLFRTLYDRLLFKDKYPALHFQEVVETRSGTVGVTPDGTLFGGGVYDGRFNIDLLHDVNMIIRPYGLSAFQSAPHRILMIGLGSGSWAQVVANHPQVDELTVVEINPGYLKLIPQRQAVASLLHNPKVRIVIDDGRRWLLWNPQAKYDAIVINTSFYWRNQSSNLLSIEFLQIARRHLKPGGVLFYNATASEDVIATALAVYPYALRFVNSIAVCDSPLILDRARWRAVLLNYVIDGKRVIDPSDPTQLDELNQIVNIPDDPTGRNLSSVENNDELRKRLQNRRIITDDNMGLEWR
jgi:spermidine synthase